MTQPQRPLSGKVVLDLTAALAGPYATLLLAGLGARVIKVENPRTGGDTARGNSPYVGSGGLRIRAQDESDMSLSMLVRGRGKESLTLDMKHPAAREIIEDLARKSDVLVENFSVGVTARLGISFQDICKINPKLVYTSISGFGAQGDNGLGKSMDTVAQALSGLMMTAGSPGDPPVKSGLPLGDLAAPLYAVIGTLAAVLQAEHTGTGQHVDVSMLGSLAALVACEPFDAYQALGLPLRTGNFVPRLAPFGIFAAKDGWFALCGPTDAFSRGVMTALDRTDLLTDPRFNSRDARVANADELHGLISEWGSTRTVSDAVETLSRNGAPAAEVKSPADAVREPVLIERGEVAPVVHPELGIVPDLTGTGIPIKLSAADTSLGSPAPRLGQHTADILRDLLGYSEDRIAELAELGVT